MSSAFLLQVCFFSACSHALVGRNTHSQDVGTNRSPATRTRSNWGRGHRRNQSAPATPRRRRERSASVLTRCPEFWEATSHSFALDKVASLRVGRPCSGGEQTVEQARPPKAEEAMYQSRAAPRARDGQIGESCGEGWTEKRRVSDEPSVEECTETRATPTAASRIANRLSLTLPIVPPTSCTAGSCAAPTATAAHPLTPADATCLMSPVDASDFITAIAAQERRVLELREELSNAEAELKRLKNAWTTHEAKRKRAQRRNAHPTRPLGAQADADDDIAAKRSIELDRRKALLSLHQHNTAEKTRGRVFSGAHTRTLSLLCPLQTSQAFSDMGTPARPSRPHTARVAPVTLDLVGKRASWTPRSTHASGMKQIAEDLKSGLWNFMEDLRQATVGEEPITGHGLHQRGTDGTRRLGDKADPSNLARQQTDRASMVASRCRMTPAIDESPSPTPSDADSCDSPVRTLSRTKSDTARPTKRFSWTPLSIDSLDESDWSNWDNPNAHSPSPRWSGTTVGGDMVPTIPETRDDADDPL